MSGLTKRGRIYYVNTERSGVRIFKSTGQTNRRLAENEAKKIFDEYAAKKTPGSTYKLSDAIKTTNKDRWSKNIDGAASKRQAERCMEIIGNLELDKVNAVVLAKIREVLTEEGKSQSTINRYNAALRTVLNDAAVDGKITATPAFKIYKEKARFKIITDKQYGLILQHMLLDTGKMKCNGTVAWRITVFLNETGARLSEVLNLTWDVVNLPMRQVHFLKTKNTMPRMLPMTKKIVEVLRDIPEEMQEGPLFPGITKWNYGDTWDICRALMGFSEDPEFVAHALRHRTATRLANNNASLLDIKDWLGHRSIQSTMIYAHLIKGSLERTRDLLDKASLAEE